MSKMLIFFRKSFPAVHEARPFQPFFVPWFDTYYNLIIKLYIHIIIDKISHQLLNGMGHNQHIHIHLSGILDLSEFTTTTIYDCMDQTKVVIPLNT